MQLCEDENIPLVYSLVVQIIEMELLMLNHVECTRSQPEYRCFFNVNRCARQQRMHGHGHVVNALNDIPP